MQWFQPHTVAHSYMKFIALTLPPSPGIILCHKRTLKTLGGFNRINRIELTTFDGYYLLQMMELTFLLD